MGSQAPVRPTKEQQQANRPVSPPPPPPPCPAERQRPVFTQYDLDKIRRLVEELCGDVEIEIRIRPRMRG